MNQLFQIEKSEYKHKYSKHRFEVMWCDENEQQGGPSASLVGFRHIFQLPFLNENRNDGSQLQNIFPGNSAFDVWKYFCLFAITILSKANAEYG